MRDAVNCRFTTTKPLPFLQTFEGGSVEGLIFLPSRLHNESKRDLLFTSSNFSPLDVWQGHGCRAEEAVVKDRAVITTRHMELLR